MTSQTSQARYRPAVSLRSRPAGRPDRNPGASSSRRRTARVLVDLKHPAHFHFLHNAVLSLIDAGHEVKITSREAPTLRALLEATGLPFETISCKSEGMFGLARELVIRDLSLLRVARRFRPHVLVAKHGVCVSHVGRLLRIPSISFEDTEHARLQIMLSWPFLTRIFTEQHFLLSAGRKHRRYNSLNSLAYLHPNRFSPDPSVRRELGLSADQPYIVLRFVGWDAAHDINHRRDRNQERRELVRELAPLARLFIVPEKSLPDDLMQYVPNIPADRFHHMLASASAHIGEGGAVAEEAALLGVPTVYYNPLEMGFIKELERFKLCHWETDLTEATALVKQWMERPQETGMLYQQRRAMLLDEKCDPTPLIIRKILAAAKVSRKAA